MSTTFDFYSATAVDSEHLDCQWKPDELEYTIWHVFLPADTSTSTIPAHPVKGSKPLARTACATARSHIEIVDDTLKPQWHCIIRMLENMHAFFQPSNGCLTLDSVVSRLRGMETGDVLVFMNRAQDRAAVFTKQDTDYTLYEYFQAFASSGSNFVQLGSYSGQAIAITNEVFHNKYFATELANFLLLLEGYSRQIGNFSADPTRANKLLTSILEGVGWSIEAPYVTEHIQSHYNCRFFSRSFLWLLIKVAIRTSLRRNGFGPIHYKVFLLHFMCNLAMDAVVANLPSHLLHAISCKILRRLRKLDSLAPRWLHDMVLRTNVSLRETLESRWEETRVVQPSHPSWKPSQLDFDADTQLSLSESVQYIHQSLRNHPCKSHHFPFHLQHTPCGSLNDFLNGPFFEEAYRLDPYIALFNVELVVEQEIDDWLACVMDVGQALCIQRVALLMEIYLSNAKLKYKGNPEHISIMLLTALELWIALDKLVVGAVPAFAAYSPEIPRELLHMLLFFKAKDLQRLSRAYGYLSDRYTHILSDWSTSTEECFRTTFTHEINHLYGPDNFAPLGVQSNGNISVIQLQCSQVVPLCFWCKATAWFIESFPSSHRSIPMLYEHSRQTFWTSPIANKTYLIFSRAQVPEQRTYGCFYYCQQMAQGQQLGEYINGTSHTSNDVISSATQAKQCPEGFSSQEFISFGHLRSGGSLQWLNILQQLRSETINFRHHDVYFLLSAAVSQVGPFNLSTSEWTWHQELQEPHFCHVLLDEVETLLKNVAALSLDSTIMGIISLLLTRLFTSNPNEEVTKRLIRYLQHVRRIVFNWVQDLSYDSMIAPLNTERKEVLRNLAATCRSTFDVGPDAIQKLLCSAEDIGMLLFCAILIRANNSITGNSHLGCSKSKYSCLLLQRDHRLSFDLRNVVADVIQADPSNRGIDLAVCGVWPGFRPGPQAWRAMPHPSSQWLTCKTAPIKNSLSQVVHLNLLNGTLLVGGRPIDGLPEEIRRQPTYTRIFGDKCFLAVPSDLPGMDFCSLAMISDHRVHFALRNGNLVIRAQHKDAYESLEVIPAEKLQGDLPRRYVDNHIHWLNLSTSIIEIRPYETLWEESSDNWRIDCQVGRYRMYKGREWLMDIRSPSYDMVSSRLKCLDDRKNLVITTLPIDTPKSPEVRQLSVYLSCYGLSFFINDDEELESREFKNMVYDEDQCIGTLFGLEYRLVLRPSIRVEDFTHRCVIVPVRLQKSLQGSISGSDSNKTSMQPVIYHTYFVDTDLGCLTGNETWESKLYLAYLHVNTSVEWMLDPLTGKTGIQEALCILQSAGCQSIVPEVGSPNSHEFSSPHHYKMYPQLALAMQKIELRNRRDNFLCGLSRHYDKNQLIEETCKLRTAYLFPFGDISAVPRIDVRLYSIESLGSLVRSISRAVYNWITEVGYGREPLRDRAGVADMPWANLGHLLAPPIAEADAFLWKHQPESSFNHRTSMYVTETVPQGVGESGMIAWQVLESSDDILATHVKALLQQSTESHQRFRLLFLLPTATYFLEKPGQTFSFVLKEALSMHFTPELSCNYNHYLPSNNIQPSQWHDFSDRCAESDQLSKVTLEQLFYDRSVPNLPATCQIQYDSLVLGNRISSHSASSCTLNQLFSSFHMNETDSAFQKQYLADLHNSAWYAREASCTADLEQAGRPPMEVLQEHYVMCKNNYTAAFITLRTELGPLDDPFGQALHRSGQWPPITPYILLQCLASTSIISLPSEWKECLLSFALLLVQLQRSRRLLQLAMDNHEEELFKELENNGCNGWNIKDYPDWLLTQIQGNFIIRGTQADVAANMISPPSEENTVMQVNMGDGKSSVILPISAATLSDGNRLVRVIVPKSLANQMTQLLVRRLGGLLNRPIYNLPFSRSWLNAEDGHMEQCTALLELFSECIRNHGILVVQPEHVLSFNLRTVEQLLSQRFRGELQVEEFQRRFHSLVRGFLDEPSDDIPHFPSQLAFTIALQRSVHSHDQDILDENNIILHPLFPLAFTTVLKNWVYSHDRGIMDASNDIDDILHLSRLAFTIALQRWIHPHVRDILDESDDILHPRFQLAYTIGSQQHVEGSPDRWAIIQQLFRLVRKHTLSLSYNLPDAIEYERITSGSFPRIRILCATTSDTSRRLISLIVDDIMNGHLHNLRFRGIDRNRQIWAAIRDFISCKDVPQSKADLAERYGREFNLWDGLLLLRGLLACNVLIFALSERRWRVDYGLSPERTMLAVPYRAKDIPAPRTEFGHPDITIILTCLSYYYGGLTKEQLRASFEILQEQDDPSKEYTNWLRDFDPGSVPAPIQDLRNVKIQSSEQWDKQIFPLFTRNQGAVDFYLSRIVFPKEAKEFSWKLTESSWDLAEAREQPITGFSGTNDGQYLLPTSITQHTLDHQRGCNARVISQLLQPENNSYMLISHPNGKRQTTLELLRTVVKQEPKISVLLDVGAQILDFSNYQLAKAWLKLTYDFDGAVYFNESDELMVLAKDGVCRPLISSPLAQRLERCAVYLDDAHTRGTDLKLPRGSRAAVTLGPKVTKDRLVQGCMRMRKLGDGHSVMFLAPLEVDQCIRAVAAKEDQNVSITTTHILQWAIHETWTDIQKWAPYWAQQGIDHKSRYDALSHFCDGRLTSEQLGHTWIQPERKSLADLYAPFQSQTTPSHSSILDGYPEIRQRCEDLGVLQLPGTQAEEEQEREVNREMERERETQSRAFEAEPVAHILHPDLVTFVKTGVMNGGSPFHPISTALKSSTAAVNEAHFWSPFLLATSDFCSILTSIPVHEKMGSYLRPVQWILSGNWGVHRVLVLLSPFEANSLMPYIRDSNHVHLHVYAPRTSERMKPSDDLMFYSIPPVPDNWTPPWDLVDQLNLFAGQLYFTDYESYRRSCVFLGIHNQDVPRSIGTAMRRHQTTPDVLQEIKHTSTNSPLKSVIKLLLIRRGGLSFGETHMGKILQGQRLTERDFGTLSVPPATSNRNPVVFNTKTSTTSHVSSSRSQSSKRGSEAVRSSDADLGSLQKRPRASLY